MALLDYMFPLGETMQQTPGLLGEDEEKKARQQAQISGLLNFGANLLANSGATQQPMSFGQRLAPALLGGYQAAQGTLEDQQKMLAARAKALEPKFTTVKEGETIYRTDRGGQPEKYLEGAPKLPGDIASFTIAKQQGLIPAEMTLSQFKNMSTPKTVIDMTGGQKGFDNEMSLKKSFAAEPTYKAFNEMQSAYGQITDSLSSASPAGDLAAATKFMKLLDPGSVVRESELGMAMAASGLLDRATNYAQMRIQGTKLTEAQRADFKKLSDALFGTATNAYNSKRGEYEKMGSAYGLDANRALGDPAKPPKVIGMPTQSDIDAEIARRKKGGQ